MGEHARPSGGAQAIRAIAALAVLASASGALQTDDEAAVERVRFVFADGTPVRSARVFHWNDRHRNARSARTDDAGFLDRSELSFSERLALPGAEFGFVVRPIPRSDDPPVVRLGAGPSLAGRITINGAPPGRVFRLPLEAEPVALGFPPELPVGPRQEILREAGRLTCHPDGAFRRAGVPLDWESRIGEWFLSTQPGGIPGHEVLRVADAPLRIDLSGPSSIVGRVMRSSAVGAPGATCRLRITVVDGWSGTTLGRSVRGVDATADGWFFIDTRQLEFIPGIDWTRPLVPWCALEVSDPESGASLVHEVGQVSTFDEGVSLDLGLLPLVPTPALRLRLVDASGASISSSPWAATEEWEAPFEDGVLAFDGLPDLESVVYVGATGYRASAIQLPVPRDEVIEVELECAQRVRVTAREVEEFRGLQLVVRLSFSFESLAEGASPPRMFREFDDVEGFPPPISFTCSETSGVALFRLDDVLDADQSEFLAWLPVPVERAHVALADRFGREAARGDVLLAGADEVELSVPPVPVPLGVVRAKVLREDGRPATGMRLHVDFGDEAGPPFPSYVKAEVNAYSVLRLDGLARRPVEIWASTAAHDRGDPPLARLIPDDGLVPVEIRLP